jgi:hypothetical protein
VGRRVLRRGGVIAASSAREHERTTLQNMKRR